MSRALLALALPALLAAQGPEAAAPRRIEVRVQAPDMVFRFAPRVEIPGMPKVALALSGGGARGLAHIGILQRLEEVGYPLDSLTGTSAGAMVAALHACGFTGREIEDLFRRHDLTRAFLEPLWRNPGETLVEQEDRSTTLLSVERQQGRLSLAQGLRSGAELQHTLQGLLARGAFFADGDFDRLGRPLRVLATNLETGQGRVFGKGDLVEAVRASMSIPGGFRPVVIEGQQYVDGALVENLPVTTAREAFRPDLVIGVDISAPLERRPATSILSVAARSLDLVVERRQWESRAAADYLLRPEIREAPFLEYGSQGGSLVRQGREGFEAQRPGLDALVRSRLSQDRLRVATVTFDTDLPAEARPLADALLRPEQGELRVQDVQIFLQQVLVHGHAREAHAEWRPDGVLSLHLQPFPPVTGLDLDAPATWATAFRKDIEAAVPTGRPFNPEAFGRLMSHLVYRALREGSPLVDARGSGFDAASGVVVIRLREPLITRVDLRTGGAAVDEAHLARLMGELKGRPFRPEELQTRVALAEHRLHLAELRYQLRPDGPGGAVLTLVPVPQQRERFDLSLGYETTLGGQVGLAYRALNLGFRGTEAELSAARNRLQEQASLTLRSPFGFAPGAGLELAATYWQQRLEVPMFWPRPELAGDGMDARISASDLMLRTYFRFSNLGTGKASLGMGRRQSAFREDGQRKTQRQDTGTVAGEWDNFDRHTLPREGLLLRSAYVLGRAEAAWGLPATTFQRTYLRARGLAAFGETFGADLDLEWGQGRNLPLDRWWALGGPSFVIGSQAAGFMAPNFTAIRLGLPVRFYLGLGLTVEASPRFDAAWVAREASGLARSDAPRALGTGLMVRTTLSNALYVEVAYGFLRTQTPQGSSPARGQLNVLVGTQPFDLWKRP